MATLRQQTVIDLFYDQIVLSVGPELGNRIYEVQAPDNYVLPLVTFFVVTDQDENLLGDGRINHTSIQVSFFGKKESMDETIVSVRTLRTISDNFINYIDGYTLSNGLSVKVINKGLTVISDINDETVHILTEFLIE